MATVTFNFTDQLSAAIAGVPLRVYDADNELQVASGTTDAAGQAVFSLAVGTYHLRVYETSPKIQLTPQYQFTVIDPGTNVFDIEGRVFIHPQSPNPRMCTVSGYLVDLTGAPLANLMIRVMSKWDPTSLGAVGSEAHALGYMTKPLVVHSDDSGYVQFDLARNADVDVVVAGLEDQTVYCCVPDTDYTDVVEWLFPQPHTLTFAPAGPLALSVGDTQALNPQLTLSSFVFLDQDTDTTPDALLEFSSSDTTVAAVSVLSGVVTVRAVGAGTATITATVKEDTFAIREPAHTFTVTAVTVNVT